MGCALCRSREAAIAPGCARCKQDKPEPVRLSLFAQALMLARALWVLGIWGRARGPFWRYLWTVLRRHRRKFGWALRLAAMGYHFRVLTDKHFGGAAARVEQPARSGQRLALGAPVAGAGKIMTKVELKETVLQR